MADYAKNETIWEKFYHWRQTTGLTNGDFTKILRKNNAAQAITVTVTELGSGAYVASYVPNDDGQWELDVYETAETRIHYQAKHIVGLVSTSITNETLYENLTNVEAGVVNAIDSQELDIIRQMVEGIHAMVEKQERRQK